MMPRLSRCGSRRDEVPREERLARSRRPHEERRRARRNAAGHHRVERLDARRRARGLVRARPRLACAAGSAGRRGCRPTTSRTCEAPASWRTRASSSPACRRTLALRSTFCVSQMMPSAIVKIGLLCDFGDLVLADEKRRRLPAGQMKREPLHELLELRLGRRSRARPCETSRRRRSRGGPLRPRRACASGCCRGRDPSPRR